MRDPAQITFDLVEDVTAGPVMTVAASTSAGVMEFIAEPERVGRTLILHRLQGRAACPRLTCAACGSAWG